MDVNKLCPGCMREIENREGVASCPNCGYDFRNIRADSHQLQPFRILNGKYIVGRVIGEGGFGISYLGYDLNLEIPVAIKEFYPNGFVTRESNVTNMVTIYAGKNEKDVSKWRDSFISEAKNIAKFSTLNGIVEVRDFFNENGTAYIVMEYIDGVTLKQYLKQNGGKIPVDTTFRMMEPVIRSLSKVHDEGIIHRDISPDNIMITKYGGMKLLDFGAAREFAGNAEKSLSIMLKPGYAPEEQYRSRGKQGPWSDVYALSATIYKCVTGVTPMESMERMRADTMTWPREMGVKISDAREAAIRQGMAVYAEDRFQSMDALYNALYSDKVPVPPPPPPPPPPESPEYTVTGPKSLPTGKTGNQTKIILIAAAAACGLLMIVLCVALLPKGGGDSRQASGYSQERQTDRQPAEEAAKEAAEPEYKSDDISAEVSEIGNSVSENSSVAELGGALERLSGLAETYGNRDGLGEQAYQIYGVYQRKTIEHVYELMGQDPPAAIYEQIKIELGDALGYVEKFKNCSIGVDSGELEALNGRILQEYKDYRVAFFDRLAGDEISANGVVSRSELWSKMNGIFGTDLYDKDNPEDPLRRRYAAALTLNVDSEISKLADNGAKIRKIREKIVEADYSPYLVYLLKELGDVDAGQWYEVYRQTNNQICPGEALFTDGDLNDVYYYYTKEEEKFEYLRESFRQAMAGIYK